MAPTTDEALLATLARKLEENTAASIKLEATTLSEMRGLREDVLEIREALRDVTRTQTDQGQRLTAAEVRINSLTDLRTDVEVLKAKASVHNTQIDNLTPAKTPWTAILSAIVAAASLAYAFFGK